MKLYWKTTLITGLLSVLFLSFAFYYEFCKPVELSHRDFYINILLGLFASGILICVSSLIGYFHERSKSFFNINSFIYSVDLALSSSLLLMDKYVNSNLRYINKLKININQTQLLINDYKTFFCFGFFHDQIENIHQLILYNSSILAPTFYIELCTNQEEYLQAFSEIKEEYKKIEAQVRKLIDTYENKDKNMLKAKKSLKKEREKNNKKEVK